MVGQTSRQGRVIRVFVSSTFRDMYEEREVLVKHVFPQLRKLCDQRGVTFTEVDLRWGITEDQAERGEVLPVCLAEVERCRPYFLGLLGERYGWIPGSIPSELVEWQPWLFEYRGRSVTELEILQAVLNDPVMATRSFFYFRDPVYIETLPVRQRDDFREEIGSHRPEHAERRGKLESLKERIRRSGVPVRENYPNPKALAELVLKDLSGVIDQDFPPGSTLDPLDRETAEHEAFARIRTGVYVGRPTYFEQLDAHAAAGGPLVVLGESGSGKSALLANWAKRYRSFHPGDFVLLHFVGASADSADWAAMLRRILGELKRHFDIDQPIPETPQKLRPAFAKWLHAASKRTSPIILIIDALNQLEARDGALDLVWLPEVLPDKVCLVVSTLPGQSLDELERRGWATLAISPLEPDERRKLIAEYLGQYSKQLGAERMDQLVAADQAANPLYLRALLEELRVWGVHKRLDERIEHYLGAKTLPNLYERILERYEADYERDRPGLVREAMSLLWAARRGLSEAELLDLLGENRQPLPRSLWSPLFLAAEKSFVNRSGLLGFFHNHLRQAVHDRYLTNADEWEVHRRLADYFEQAELGFRKVDELPWQLARSFEFDRLHDLLRDLEFLKAAFAVDPAQLKQYWSVLEHEVTRGFRMADAYCAVIDNPADHLDLVAAVGTLLNETGHWEDYAQLGRGLIDHYRRTEDRDRLSNALGNQASLLIRKGVFDEAASLLSEAREIIDKSRNPWAMEGWLGTMAMLMFERGDLSDAWTTLGGQEAILRDLGDKVRLSGCLIQKSFILHSRGQHPEALALLQEAMRLAQEYGDLDSRQAILGEMAVNHLEMREREQALKLLEEQADLCRQLGDLESLAGSLGNQGNIHLARGDLEKALALYQGSEQIGKRIGHGRVEHVGRSGQAQVFFQADQLKRAAQLLEGIPEFFRTTGMKDPLWRALLLEGDLLLADGNLDSAVNSFSEAVEVCGQVSTPLQVAGLLRSIAAKLLGPPKRTDKVDRVFTIEEYEQAVSWFDRSREQAAKAIEYLKRATLVDPSSAETHHLLGIALEELGRNQEALASHRQALALRPGWTDAEVCMAELLMKGGSEE